MVQSIILRVGTTALDHVEDIDTIVTSRNH